MDPLPAEVFLLYLNDQRQIVDYAFVAAAVVLVYDYLVTLESEITLVWFSPWNYTKVLFLLVRYLPISLVYFMLYNQLLLNATVEQCQWSFPVLVWLMMAGIICSEIVLTVRTWAVWRRDRRVGFGLGFLVVCVFTSSMYGGIEFSRSLQLAPVPYSGFRGCFVVATGGILGVEFLIFAGSDTIVLVLMVISAFRTYKRGDNNKLLTVIHRDGILFYIYLLCVTVLNVICLNASPHYLAFTITPMCGVLYSVFTCRIVLDIRNLSRRDAMNSPTELHGYYEASTVLMPMAFRSGVNPREGGEGVLLYEVESPVHTAGIPVLLQS